MNVCLPLHASGYIPNEAHGSIEPTHLPISSQVSLPTGTHSAGGVVPAGALSSYTSRLLSSKPFQDFRSFAKGLNRLMPSEIQVSACLPAVMRDVHWTYINHTIRSPLDSFD